MKGAEEGKTVLINYCIFAEDLSKARDAIKEDSLKALEWQSKSPKLDPAVYYQFRSDVEILYAVLDFLIRLDERFESVKQTARRLEHGTLFGVLPYPTELSSTLRRTLAQYKERRERVAAKLSFLDEQERRRINEAWHSLREECYWSCIVNCAVAIESRLWRILERRNPQALRRLPRYPKLTLGDLIGAYMSNKTAFGTSLPKKYDGLLGSFNEYRIISAHARDEAVCKGEADALFNLALALLLDDSCMP